MHQLAIDDLELAGCSVITEDGGAGCVERLGLHVFVKVWSSHSADPIIASLERFAWAGACGCASGDWCARENCGCCWGLRFGFRFGLRVDWECRRSAGLALGVVVTAGLLEVVIESRLKEI